MDETAKQPDLIKAAGDKLAVDFCAYMWTGQSQGKHVYYALECDPPNTPRPLYADVFDTPPTCAGTHTPPLCQTVTKTLADGRLKFLEAFKAAPAGDAPLTTFHDPLLHRFAAGAVTRIVDEAECRCRIGGHKFAFLMYLTYTRFPGNLGLNIAVGFERDASKQPSEWIDLGEIPSSHDLGRYAFRANPFTIEGIVFTHRTVPR